MPDQPGILDPASVAAVPRLRPGWWRGPDLAWILGAAVVIRAVALAGWGMIGADSMHFVSMAGQIASGASDLAWAHPNRYHPGYPGLMAAVYACVAPLGLSLDAAGLILSVVAGILMVVPVYLLARWAYGEDAAVLAGLLAAFHPEWILLSVGVKTETTFFCLQGAAIVFLARGLTTRSWLAWAAAGLASAGALWIRPEGIYSALLLVAGGVHAMVSGGVRRDARAATGAGARLVLAGVLLVLAYSPYLLWIHRTTGRWFFTNKGSAVGAAQSLVQRPAELAQRDISSNAMHRAFGRSTAYWSLVPWLAVGLVATVRRRVWNAPGTLALALAGIGCGSAVAAHLLIRYAVSPRYFMQGAVFLVPLAGFGLATAGAWAARRWPGRERAGRTWVAVPLVLAMALGIGKAIRSTHDERITLREAGEWVLTHIGPHQYMLSQEEQPAHYARTQQRPVPRAYEAAERELVASPGRLLVLMEMNFDDLEPGFRTRLESGPLERLAEFPDPPRPGVERVWVYRSRGRPAGDGK
jgi:hypothetical protein